MEDGEYLKRELEMIDGEEKEEIINLENQCIQFD